jgi:hypothetical protein
VPPLLTTQISISTQKPLPPQLPLFIDIIIKGVYM